jgi:hypothetical protein
MEVASNDHTTAIVPIETWAYASPMMRMHRRPIDVGLLAEALIYYDRVLLAPSCFPSSGRVLSKGELPENSQQEAPSPRERLPFIEMVNWFHSTGALSEFLALLADGTLTIYHYAFVTLPLLKDGQYSVWNAEDEEEAKRPLFLQRIAGHPSLHDVLPKARQREKLYRVLQDKVIERTSAQFERAVENARHDFVDEVAGVRVVQAFVDEVRPLLPDRFPERVMATSVDRTAERTRITYNVNFNEISRSLAPNLTFSEVTPLVGLAQSNRILWSAALEYADLYLPAPLSVVSSLKLTESNERRTKHRELVQTLEREVDFPDVRRLVNEGALSFKEVLVIRRHAAQFRNWLQTRAERDSNALIAYHEDVAKASGVSRAGTKVLRVFGMVAGSLGTAYARQAGLSWLEVAAAGTAISTATKYVTDLAAKLDADWKPVIFGNWAKGYVVEQTMSVDDDPRLLK